MLLGKSGSPGAPGRSAAPALVALLPVPSATRQVRNSIDLLAAIPAARRHNRHTGWVSLAKGTVVRLQTPDTGRPIHEAELPGTSRRQQYGESSDRGRACVAPAARAGHGASSPGTGQVS